MNEIKQLVYIKNSGGDCPPEAEGIECSVCILDRFCDVGSNSRRDCRIEAEIQLENFTEAEVFEALL